VGAPATVLGALRLFLPEFLETEPRLIAVDDRSVTFRWIDRSDHNRVKVMTLPGTEFVARYLRHVLPQGLRSIRYYGFCHPSAKANRMRLQLLTGMSLDLGSATPRESVAPPDCNARQCLRCGGALRLLGSFSPVPGNRGPPRAPPTPDTLAQQPSPTA
jgi:hypothetical protein